MAYKKTQSQEKKDEPKAEETLNEEPVVEKTEECCCHDEKCECKNCEQDEKPDLAQEYLNMARIIQADFDNYRKRSMESIRQAKIDGKIEAIEVFLPCLDVFKKAKQMVNDPASKKGIEMVENEIQNSLNTLGVKKIEAIGKPFDPKYHHALSTMIDNTKPDGEVLDEYQAGYIYNDKVIKYSQVIVNKLKEEKNE